MRVRQKEGNRPRKPAYRVRTVFGTSILGPKSRPIIRGDGAYFQRPARLLQSDDEVLFAKEWAGNVSISLVQEALAKSERYASTTPTLFRRLDDGKHMPLFSFALFDGMRSKPAAWPRDLGPAISSPDFRPGRLGETERRLAAEHIKAKLDSDDIRMSADDIAYGWLEGNVVSPEDRSGVVSSLLPLAEGLQALLSKEFDEAYRLYMVMCQDVMRSISQVLGRLPENPGQDSDSQPIGESISLGPALELIANGFVSDVSTRFAFTRILEVKRVEQGSEGSRNLGMGTFFRGILTRLKADLPIEVKPYQHQEPEVSKEELLGRLHSAIIKNDYDGVVSAMEAGADVNAFHGATGKTALTRALATSAMRRT